MKVEKAKFGVSGLDELLEGGIPKGHHVIVCGGPGSGKTLACAEFIYRGAQAGDNGIYISVEETKEKLIENIKTTFPDWKDFDKLMEEKKILVEKIYPGGSINSFDKFANKIQELAMENSAKRITIDSSTILKSLFDSPREYRMYLFALLEFLSRMDATVFITMELANPEREELVYEIEQFLADGVIMLYNLVRGEERVRAVEILKMRGTSHSHRVVPFKITTTGLQVFPSEKIY